jgi:hypothetical protein
MLFKVSKARGLRVCVRTGRETAGPSTTLRSGRDDNSVCAQEFQREILDPRNRIVIPTGAKRSGGTCGFSSSSHTRSLAP